MTPLLFLLLLLIICAIKVMPLAREKQSSKPKRQKSLSQMVSRWSGVGHTSMRQKAPPELPPDIHKTIMHSMADCKDVVRYGEALSNKIDDYTSLSKKHSMHYDMEGPMLMLATQMQLNMSPINEMLQCILQEVNSNAQHLSADTMEKINAIRDAQMPLIRQLKEMRRRVEHYGNGINIPVINSKTFSWMCESEELRNRLFEATNAITSLHHALKPKRLAEKYGVKIEVAIADNMMGLDESHFQTDASLHDVLQSYVPHLKNICDELYGDTLKWFNQRLP